MHEEHLSRGDVVPPGAESLDGEHVGVSFHRAEGEVERIALQHYLEPPQVWVEEDHPIPPLSPPGITGWPPSPRP